MKKILLTPLLFFICLPAFLQAGKKIESLDRFFGGVPLYMDYSEWIQFVTTQYSIDSFRQNFLFSSFKPDTPDRFPFPAHIIVKITLFSGVKNVPSASLSDTIRSISVSGHFGPEKADKKEATVFFKQVKEQLKLYYRKHVQENTRVFFYDGINEHFPEMRLSLVPGKGVDKSWRVALNCQLDHWVKTD